MANFDYVYSELGISLTWMDNMVHTEPTAAVYEIRKNSTLEKTAAGEKLHVEEFVYDSKGLTIFRFNYLNGDTTSKAIISYSYY